MFYGGDPLIDLSSRHALVTGGGSGIGRGICKVLAKCGADVTVVDIDVAGAEDTAGMLAGRGQFRYEQVDVTSIESVTSLLQRVLEYSVKVDILVNNAGIIGSKDWWTREEPNGDDWDDVFAVNVKGVATVTDIISSHMVDNNYGKIVNIASIAARQGSPENPHYSTSKAAVVSLTQSIALKLANNNINVNAVCPGLLWTPMWEAIAEKRSRFGGSGFDAGEVSGRQLFEKAVESWIPMQKEQKPEDIGNLVAFLVSDLSENITGQSINVDGGRFMN